MKYVMAHKGKTNCKNIHIVIHIKMTFMVLVLTDAMANEHVQYTKYKATDKENYFL